MKKLSKEEKLNQELGFLTTFKQTDSYEQYCSYLAEHGYSNKTEKEIVRNYNASVLLLPYEPVVQFLQDNNYDIPTASSNFDAICAVSENFKAPKPVVRFRLECVGKLHKKQLQPDEKSKNA